MLIQQINETIEMISKAERKVCKKYNKIAKNGLENMAETAVDEFYNNYDPNSYKRKESLLHAFKVVATDDEWSIDFGARYMRKYKHHQKDNNIIYHNAFELGYHGGSWGKADEEGFRPPEGVPYYRGPGGEYNFPYWLYSAEQDDISPYENILSQDPQGFIDENIQRGVDEFDSILMPYVNKIKKTYRKFIGG